MTDRHFKLLIIGGGAAGMAAALSALDKGIDDILIVDRNPYLGGILPQCIHNGFGLGYFKEDLTGPQYAARFIEKVEKSAIKLSLDTMALEVKTDKTAVLSSAGGIKTVSFDNLVLATGARERAIGSLPVAGSRPAGIFTAGQAQKLVNIYHYDIGENIVVLGSGDIGQIMARRFSIMGKKVIAMIEKEDKLGGLVRNQENCIKAFNIPVFLNSTIVKIFGDKRISAVLVRNLLTGEENVVSCDTLLTAVGLIKEQEIVLNLKTENGYPKWLKLCGNCDYIHEIVDTVSFQAEDIEYEG